MQRIEDNTIQDFEIRHINAVRKAAPECVVLLKNNGTLPLKKTGELALYGSGARRTIKGGTGSGDVNVRHFVTIEEGLENAGFEITSKSWLDEYDAVMEKAAAAWNTEIQNMAKELGVSPFLAAMGKTMPEPEYELPMEAKGDTAVYVLSRNSGEGNDRKPVVGDTDLSETEIRDILALNRKYDHFVLVLNTGGMINLEPVKDVDSILLLGQLGTPTGDVCADVLLGKSTPSGKLAMTWDSIEQYASTKGFGDINDTRYKEGVYVGYRYFDSVNFVPAYPFGFGLSYTEFGMEIISFKADTKKVSVTVGVQNTGSMAGKEVVQVYYSAPWGALDRPYQELAGFAKTRELKPHEKQEVTVEFALTSMAGYSEEKASWVLEKGDYVIRAGSCSDHTEICGIVRLEGDAVVCRTRNICPGCDFTDFVPDRKAEEIPENIAVIDISAKDIAAKDITYSEIPVKLQAGERINWEEVKSGTHTVDEFLAGLTEEELACICIGNYDENASQNVIGSGSGLVAGGAGDTTGQLRDLGLDSLSMADGPAGLRLSRKYKIVDGRAEPMESPLAEMMPGFTDGGGDAAVKPSQLSETETAETVYYQYCTAIPIGTALAQSFSEEVSEICGDIVGEEMEVFGVNLWLAPALNIQRSPLCGRNFEYYSEDPLLGGKIAAAITRGVQKHPGCGTTIKHLAANNQETNRYASNSIVSERALREIYLKGFEICVKESAPAAIMTSYNLINGEHSCNSRDLLTSVIRDEWEYQGVVMTDWFVTSGFMKSPGSVHSQAFAAGCVKAGNNITMPGMSADKEDILNALHDEAHPYKLTLGELQACAKMVLTSVLRIAN